MSFSQPFYIYTAKANGLWSQAQNWNIQLRTDGIARHKFVIPGNVSITINNDISNLGDVEINISGTLSLAGSTNLHLSNNSIIVLNNGTISGDNANEKIKIGNQIKYKGNVDGVVTGYWIADNTSGSAPNGFKSFSMLPVNFTSFHINKSGNNIQLVWSTDIEIRNSHYEIERSINGRDWSKIAVVLSAANSNNGGNYDYTDQNILGEVVYYRLRQVDLDGRSTYSSVKTIRLSEAISAIKIYGSEKKVIIDLSAAIKNTVVVSIVNNNGQVIHQQSYSNPSYKINLNLYYIANGAYIVHVANNKGWSEVKKVIL
jgi:hypothetical protein